MPGKSLTERNELERRVRALEDRLARVNSFVGVPAGSVVYDVTLSGTLTGTSFTMSRADLVPNSIELVLRGRTLKYAIDFTASGAALTTTDPPFEVGDPGAVASFDNFFVRSAKRTA